MADALEIGACAPQLTMETDTQKPVTLEGLAGKKIILYFYPKDDTPGCTKEAIAFTGMQKEFDAENAIIIGVSKDSVEKHAKFRNKHDLSVVLGSDPDGDVCESYGVWVEKNMYGRKYMGIERATFLIDEKGIIRHIWRKVKVAGHAEAVLDAVKAL